MWGKLQSRLCDEARNWYKLWSTWLAVAYGTAMAAFWNDPTIFGAIATALPERWRAPLTPLVFILTTVLPIVVRLWKQKPASGQ